MERTVLMPRWRHCVAAVSLLLFTHTAQAQSHAAIYCGPVLPHTFYDELIAVEGAFAGEGAGDVVVFATEAATPDYINGRIMNATQLLNFVNTHQLAVDNGANSVLYDQNRDVLINGQQYNESYSYGIERKTFDQVTIDGETHEGVRCLQIVELLNISNEMYPEPAEIENTYYVLYDAGDAVIGVFGYNEVFTDATVAYQKYSFIPVAGDGWRMAPPANSNKLFSVHPNPATSSVTINFMLDEEDDALITIRDLSGKMVKQTNIGKVSKEVKQSHTEDISQLPAGVYTVSLTTTRSMQTVKLTVE